MIDVLTAQVEQVDPYDLLEHPRNPNRGDVEAIAASIQAHGFYGALIVQRSTRYILSGNHRYKAACQLKMPTVPVIYVDVDDERALRILLADNRTSELGHRDVTSLLALLDELDNSRTGLGGIGYTLDDIEELRVGLDNLPSTSAEGSDDNSEPTSEDERGSLLSLKDVIVSEPEQKVHAGEVWQLGDKFTLIVANPIHEMAVITPYLKPDTVFLPFGGGFIGYLDTPHKCVIAQPNLYVAAFIIDRYKRGRGANSVRRLK